MTLVTLNNYKEAIKVQNDIFPHEDGTLNILASLNRSLFIEKTNLVYPYDNVTFSLFR